MECKNSRLSGFYKKNQHERLALLQAFTGLSNDAVNLLKNEESLFFESANRMIENVVSTMQLPFGIATNFIINGHDYLIPMVLEEPSVVAGASNAARLARGTGGFIATASHSLMVGTVQLVKVPNTSEAIQAVETNKKDLLVAANSQDSILCALGGGAKNITTRTIATSRGIMLLCELAVDVRDAMGANIINTMAEHIAPMLEKITGGTAILRIVSNLAIHRMAKAHATWKKEALGSLVIEHILDAYALACANPLRCTTHNKGVMNGIDAVAIATGNDFRALEAGAHAYASLSGSYQPLTHYHTNPNGDLVGEIELPLAVGTIGGATQTHPIAKVSLEILGITKAQDLACIMASVGLAQNFAALRALVLEGIQAGHMKLHSKNIAMMAGAQGNVIDHIAHHMCQEGTISVARAKELLDAYGKNN